MSGRNGFETRRILSALGFALIAFLALASGASALTLFQISGAGDIEIEVDGSIYLDTGGNELDSITLAAGALELGASLPAADGEVALTGLDGYAATFSEDVSLEIVSWTGTLSVTASGSVLVGGGLVAPIPAPQPGGCNEGGGVVLDGGSVIVDGCRTPVIGLPPGGGIITIGGSPGLTMVPEPSAALLFSIGLVLVRARTSGKR